MERCEKCYRGGPGPVGPDGPVGPVQFTCRGRVAFEIDIHLNNYLKIQKRPSVVLSDSPTLQR